jgi:hypothetical protein
MGFFAEKLNRWFKKKPYKVEVMIKVANIELGPIRMVVMANSNDTAHEQSHLDIKQQTEFVVNVLGKMSGAECKVYNKQVAKHNQSLTPKIEN